MKALFLIIFIVAVLPLYGKTEALKGAEGFHNSSKSYGKADYFTLKNELNEYMLYFQRTHASAKRDSSLSIGLPKPNFWSGFVARGFMHVTVNNIESSVLEPKSMKIWNKTNLSGVDVVFNFDGVKLTFRFFVREDSPVLWIEIIHDNKSDPIETIFVNFVCHPSFSVNNGGKPDSSYRRVIVTALRKVKAHKNKRGNFYFKDKDQYLIYGDEFYEPGANDKKSQGPCFLRLDWTGVKWVSVWFGNIYCAVTKMEFKPEVGIYRFGIFETKKRISNQEFLDKIKKNPGRYNFQKVLATACQKQNIVPNASGGTKK